MPLRPRVRFAMGRVVPVLSMVAVLSVVLVVSVLSVVIPAMAPGRVALRSWPDAALYRRSSKMRTMRRSGSAAPHNSWSPTVNADR